MRIAVIGTGISGLASAYLLQRRHELLVFEQNGYIGGHTNTISVAEEHRELGVDTGFIVFNPRRYPNLVRLFDELGVATQETDMSFSVRCHRCGLQYSPQTAATMFAQKRNLFRPSFYQLIRQGRRLAEDARQFLVGPAPLDYRLHDYLVDRRYGREVINHLIMPLAAAIWSCSPADTLNMPAQFCLRFFDNHCMLDRERKPTWRTVVGGSRTYVTAITASFRDGIRLANAVSRVERHSSGVVVHDQSGQRHECDAVVIAAHADQALRMLAEPTDQERRVLGAFSYSRNHTVLHTDATVLPDNRALHASWNYELEDCQAGERQVSLTYYMNRLQRIQSSRDYCVTLNRRRAIAPDRVLRQMTYEHPLFTRQSLSAQRELPQLNGVRNTWYCGAYHGYGFHEDGLVSALAVTRDFGITLDKQVSSPDRTLEKVPTKV